MKGITAKPSNKKYIIKSFLDNMELIQQRKNGIYLLHQIISLPKNLEISRNKQKEYLDSMTREWIEKIYPSQMSFYVIHEDKEHYHSHIALTVNSV